MKILLADDHGLFRDSMSVWLKQLNDELTFGFAESYQDVEDLLHASQGYDLVMLDLSMPGMQGILSIKQLCAMAGNTPVLIVSADEDGSAIQSAMDAGAAGYVTKSSTGEKILDAVQIVISGGRCFPAEIQQSTSSLDTFSDKQQQLLALIAEGNSNKYISEKLCLSEGTVKQYLNRLYRLLMVDNRTQASIKARKMLRIGTS